MSATFDSMMFARYFALPVMDRLEQAPVVDVEGKPFNVLEFYAEDIEQLGPVCWIGTIGYFKHCLICFIPWVVILRSA